MSAATPGTASPLEAKVTPEQLEDARRLSQAIWDFARTHGTGPMIGVLGRSLIGLGHVLNAEQYEFADELGRVLVTRQTIPAERKN